MNNHFKLNIITVTLTIFFIFTIIPLIGLAFYSYQSNETAALITLKDQVERNKDTVVQAASKMVENVGRTIAVIGDAVATNPAQFKVGEGDQVLWRGLTAADQIDALYVSFEDGYHRVVSRVDEDRRQTDQRIPQNANWHVSFIDDFTHQERRARHRWFYEEWGDNSLTSFSLKTELDIRQLPHYMDAKNKRALSIGEVSINPDTGFSIISLGFPIINHSGFIGFVGANMTLSNISDYLKANKISENSISVIYNKKGTLVASSDVGLFNSSATKNITGTDNLDLKEAYASRELIEGKPTTITTSSGKRISAMAAPFPVRFEKDWWVLTITPIDDFVGHLIKTNRDTAILILTLSLIIMAFILLLAMRLKIAMNFLVDDFNKIGQFELIETKKMNSIVNEFDAIEQSKERMKISLRSFSRYVPKDLVRELITSGKEAQLGGERRRVTVHFSDIVGFTPIAEKLEPEQLAHELSEYFTLMRDAIIEQSGVVKEYMGDGIMALFNAPVEIRNHETKACLAALESQKKLLSDRERRASSGSPLFASRIGLSVGEVLVGNIGTADRFSYTVIGDPVNLASRLEGLCKFYSTEIIVSENLRGATDDQFEWRLLDLVAVVGRSSGNKIFELLGQKGDVENTLLQDRDTYELALKKYWSREFESAHRDFNKLSVKNPKNEAATVMARRSLKLAKSPPPLDWDGVYIHTKK